MSAQGIGDMPKLLTNSEVRLKLLGHLAKGAMTPTELASLENKHISHISRALAELKAQGLVAPLPTQSRDRYYKATKHGVELYVTLLTRMK